MVFYIFIEQWCRLWLSMIPYLWFCKQGIFLEFSLWRSKTFPDDDSKPCRRLSNEVEEFGHESSDRFLLLNFFKLDDVFGDRNFRFYCLLYTIPLRIIALLFTNTYAHSCPFMAPKKSYRWLCSACSAAANRAQSIASIFSFCCCLLLSLHCLVSATDTRTNLKCDTVTISQSATFHPALTKCVRTVHNDITQRALCLLH